MKKILLNYFQGFDKKILNAAHLLIASKPGSRIPDTQKLRAPDAAGINGETATFPQMFKKHALKLVMASCLLLSGFTQAYAANSTGGGTTGTAANLNTSQTNIAILGFNVTTTAARNVTAFNFSVSSTAGAFLSTYFGSVTLYHSTSATFSLTTGTIATPVAGATFAGLGTTTPSVSGFTDAVNNRTEYYYIVVTYTLPNPTNGDTFILSLTSATLNGGNSPVVNTVAGPTYVIPASLSLGAASTVGLATATQLSSTQGPVGILGFSITTTVNETVNSMAFSAAIAPANTIGNFFSGVTLFVSNTNSFAAATAVPAGYTVSALTGTTFTISGLTEAINSTTKYYFIEANYTQPASGSTTFQLSATSVTNSTPTTFTKGGPIAGISYTLTCPTLTATDLTGANLTGGTIYQGQANIAVAGVSFVMNASTTTLSQLVFTVSPSDATAFNYFANPPTLVTCPTATYNSGTAVAVSTAGNTFTGTTFVFNISPSTTVSTAASYYFLVLNYNVAGGATPQAFTFNPTSYTSALGTVTPAYTANTYTCTGPPLLSYAATPYTFVQGTVTTIPIVNNGGAPTSAYAETGALPTGITFNTASGLFSIAANATVGTYTFTVNASNPAGSSTPVASISITINPKAPVISYTPATYTFYNGVGGTTSAATNTGGTATYAVDATTPFPAYLSIDPATGIITASSAAATTAAVVYKIDASNITGTSSANVTITIAGPPLLSYAGTPYTYVQGTVTTIPIVNGGGPVTSAYTETGVLPTGITFNTASGLFSIAANATIGTYTFTVNASNPAGSSTPAAAISITINPKAPVISYTPSSYTFPAGVGGTTSAATNTGGTATYAVDATTPFPAYLSIDPVTGIITASSAAVTTAAVVYKIDATNVTGTASANVTITILSPPGFTYTAAAAYPDGTAMSLSPVNNAGAGNVAAMAYGPGVALTATGLSSPYGMAFDAAGNLYVVNEAAGTVVKYTAGGGTATSFITGLTNPTGIVFDSAGNVYVSQLSGGVFRYTSTGTGKTTIVTAGGGTGTRPASAYGLAIDASNNLYIADRTTQVVYKYTASTATTSQFITTGNLRAPVGVAVDASGNIYVSDITRQKVEKYNSGGTGGAQLLGGLTTPYGLSVDASGNLYVGDSGTGTVTVYNQTTGASITSVNNTDPRGIAVDGAGDLFVSNFGANSVTKYVPVGGYSLGYVSGTTSLPPGLTFDSTTGVISGTPTSTFSGTYTVTGYNAAGPFTCTSFTINCGVAPAITYTTPNVWTVGTAYTLSPTSTGGAVTTWAISGTLPAGVTFNTSTGVISGTPTAVMALTSYTVTATNSFGTSSPAFTITVNQVSPNISYVTPDVYTVGAVVSLPVTNPNSAVTTSYAVTSGTLPAGLSLNTSTGLISGTTTTVTAATTVTITAYTGTSTGVTTVAITVNPLPPNISYTNPAPYVQGTTIANLVPSNSGGPVSTTGTYGPGVVVMKAANGMNKPYGMTADASGNVYVVNFAGNSISEYSTTGTITTTSISAGGTGPSGVVFDSAGNAYVLFKTSNKVVEYPGGNFAGTGTTIITGLNAATGIAIDSSDELYIANAGANNILEYTTAGVAGLIITPPASIFTEFANVSAGIAVDASGNIYVADANLFDLFGGFFGTTVDVYSSAGTFTGFYEIGTTNSAVSIDASGNIYLTDTGAGTVTVYAGNLATAATDTETGYNSPQGTVADGLGDYFVSDYNANTVTEYSPVKGYYLTGTLPPGLYFDPTTGIVSGRPQTTFGLTTYTVTAYNVSGKSTTTFKISCGANPPVISYAPNPDVYQLGLPVSGPALSVSGGPELPSSFTTPGTALTGVTTPLSNPWGMSKDVSGDIWVANAGNATVDEYGPTGTFIKTYQLTAGTVGTITGVVVDPTKTFIYVSNSIGRVYKYVLASGVTTNTINLRNGTYNQNNANIYGIAEDASGNIYFDDEVNGGIWKYTGAGNATELISPPIGGITNPTGIAVDAAGNIFIVDLGVKKLIEYSPLGAFEANIEAGLTTPYGLYIDANGDYFLSDPGSGTVREYSEGGGTIVTKITGLTNPRGLVTDASGDIYVSDYTNNTVTKYTPVYYTISPALPAGLTFNTVTGAITGTPTVVFGPTLFTVTVDGADGNASTTFTLTCASAPVFSYASPQVYPVGVAIPTLSPTVTAGGPITSTSVSPALPAGLSIDASGNITGTPTSPSPTTTYTVTATNSYGFTGTATVVITCAYAPVFSYASPQVYPVGTAIATLAPTITAGGPFTGTSVSPSLPPGLSIDAAGNITGTPTAASPTTTYTVTATNASGLTGTATVVITCAYTPSFTYTSPQTYIDGTAIPTLSPIFTVPNGGGPLTSASVTTNGPLPPGLTLNPDGTITGTPTTINGPVTYTITGTNAAGLSGTATVTITCNPALPIISYITPDIYNVGTAITPLTPTNTGGPVASWSISPGLPAGLTFDTTTGIISGTPTVISAAANYVVTATNVTGSATFTINITVTIDAPIIAYTTPDVYTVGSVIPPLVPTNTGGAVATWAISPALPAGLTFDTTTGIITGTPTAPSPAANYVVTATNTGGSSMFTINITCVNGGPVLSYITPDVFPVNVAITPLSPVNTGTAPVSYAISPGLPAGLNFDTTTGIISGTPTVTSPATTYTVTATDAGSNMGTTTISIACSGYVDWIGVTSTDWNDPTNWASGAVPIATDIAAIGVNQTFLNFPNLGPSGAATNSVAAVVIGSSSTKVTTGTSATAQAGGMVINSGSILNVSGTITYQSDANAGTLAATISGAGVINAAGIGVTANTTLGATYTETLASSVSNLNLSSGIALTSSDNAGTAFNSAFNITGGTVAVAGTVTTTNTAAATSTLSVAGATLQLAGASPLSGLSATGTNAISFNNAGATIEYSGAGQTYYTDANITGLNGGVTYTNIKFSGSGVKSPTGTNASNLKITGDFTNALTTNDAADYIDLGNPQVNFNGTSQNIYGGNGTGTKFNMVTISTAGTATIQSGAVAVASTGMLTMSGASATLAAGGFLTLNSDINGSASVAAIPAGCSVTGNVNVQRFITGGGLNYRDYRLVSSPVYGSTSGSVNIFSINYLLNSVYLKGLGGVAGGFDDVGNPNVYLFRENLAPSNVTFSSGNFRSINNIGFAPNFSYLIDNDPGTFNIPAGNGFMFFFRGDRHVAPISAEQTTTYIPTNTILTATGTLNQGTVTVSDWYTPASANLGWTTTAGNAAVQGYNLVGNPYASSIDWDQYVFSAPGSAIYAPNVNPFIYIIDPVSNNYNVYMAGGGGVGTIVSSLSNIIPSGQGFFVRANAATAQLVFNESAKVATQANAANGNLLMGHPVAAAAVSQFLHLKILKDTVSADGMIISFRGNTSNTYNANEDAMYRNGNGAVSISSMSADNVPLAINSMPLPAQTAQTIIPLTVKASTDGTAQIQMAEIKSIPALFTIWLKDAYRKDSLDMRANSTYLFDILHSDTNSYGSHRFSLVMGENPQLMIHLLSFGASEIQTGDQVVWTTENEQNYTNFTVERSTDNGTTFNDLGGFASSGQGTYSYLDKIPVNGANMYRLKIVDLNGTISYSNVVTIMYANTNGLNAINGLMVYPNPTAATIHLSITNNQTSGTTTVPTTNSNYNIEIVNNLGSVIKSSQSNSPSWQSDVSSLTPGTYFIRVIDTSNSKVVGKTAFVKM